MSKASKMLRVLRTVPFVPGNQTAVEVWNCCNKKIFSAAIVFDEFGGTGGMITMEDLALKSSLASCVTSEESELIVSRS